MGTIRRAIDGYMERRLPAVSTAGLTEAQRLSICQVFGRNSLAYSSAVQPDLLYHPSGNGYVAFARKMGHTFVLGDPLVAPDRLEESLRGFLDEAGDACFVQIGRQTAEVLAGMGFRVNQLGVETVLTLSDKMFSGQRNQSIRYSERWLLQRGYQLHECQGAAETAEAAAEISSEWRSGRIVSRREMRFLNRPFQPEPSPGMRRFLLRNPEGQIVALLDFDPVFEQGRIAGYTTAFKRKRSGTSPHAEIALTKYAADRFHQEGFAFVTLGLSPLAGIAPSGLPESRIWRQLFDRAYHSKRINERIFNLQGQAAFKKRFHGEEVPSYIAFRSATPVRMVALLRLLKTL